MIPSLPWTADLVGQHLVQAFRLMPDAPVMSRAGSFTVDGREIAAFGWPERFVADRRDRCVVMTWARCRAIGASVRQRYDALDWPRAQAERRRRAALATIAAGLNAATGQACNAG